MATIKSANRWPLYLALGVLLLGGGVATVSLLPSQDGAAPTAERGVPRAPEPDADTPTETLNHLVGQVEAQKQANHGIVQQNRELAARLETLNTHLGNVQRDNASGRLPTRDPQLLKEVGNITRVMSQLAQRVGQLETLPVATGLGLDDTLPTRVEPANAPPSPLPSIAPTADPNERIWIQPLDAPAVPSSTNTTSTAPAASPAPSEGPSLLTHIPSLDDVMATPNAATTNAHIPTAATARANAQPAASTPTAARVSVTPRYTIPPDSKLLGATLWTALLGRIPVGGRVPDPWQFTVLTGADNLAANGIHIPDLEGAVWSGVARGDLLLSCVSGALTSVTFNFKDGTIVNHKAMPTAPLGYLSDESGVPCVSGRLITNAPAYITGSATLLALEGAAAAFAQRETSSVVSSSGTINSTVDGNVGRFVLGEALGQGADEAAHWLRQRQGQSFDAVFVEPGARVALNIDTLLPIDHDRNGRRVAYRPQARDAYSRARLD